MTLEINVDPGLCIGSGTCIHLAPGAFEFDRDGVSMVRTPNTATEHEVLLAERSCPTAAITVERSATHEGKGEEEHGHTER